MKEKPILEGSREEIDGLDAPVMSRISDALSLLIDWLLRMLKKGDYTASDLCSLANTLSQAYGVAVGLEKASDTFLRVSGFDNRG